MRLASNEKLYDRGPKLMVPMRQSGLSIIEIVIALAIIGIVATVLGRVTKAISDSAATEEARREAKAELSQALAMFVRDVDKLDYDQIGLVACNGLSCTIPTKTGNVVYKTSCISGPAGLSAVDLLTAAPGQCLTTATCSKGKMPILDLTRPGDPVRRFPIAAAAGGAGVTKHAVGAMACFRRLSSTELTINLTYFYLQTREKAQILRHSVTLPTAKTPGMQIIRDHM